MPQNPPLSLIVSFTDFGPGGPYVGQMHAVLLTQAPGTPVVELLSLAPGFSPRPAAYLLAALADEMPPGSLFVCVVDPGVGSDRQGLVVRTDRHWFVGPDNGLLAVAARRDPAARAWVIDWRPERLSASFHGRDLFAPVAAGIARGEAPPGMPVAPRELVGWSWPADLPELVFIDHYGNAFTGLRAVGAKASQQLLVGGHRLAHARTFSEVPHGVGFWYANSCGLVEIAVNGGAAASRLGLAVGDKAYLVDPGQAPEIS